MSKSHYPKAFVGLCLNVESLLCSQSLVSLQRQVGLIPIWHPVSISSVLSHVPSLQFPLFCLQCLLSAVYNPILRNQFLATRAMSVNLPAPPSILHPLESDLDSTGRRPLQPVHGPFTPRTALLSRLKVVSHTERIVIGT